MIYITYIINLRYIKQFINYYSYKVYWWTFISKSGDYGNRLIWNNTKNGIRKVFSHKITRTLFSFTSTCSEAEVTFKFNFWKISLINILSAVTSYIAENCWEGEAAWDKGVLRVLDCLYLDAGATHLSLGSSETSSLRDALELDSISAVLQVPARSPEAQHLGSKNPGTSL